MALLLPGKGELWPHFLMHVLTPSSLGFLGPITPLGGTLIIAGYALSFRSSSFILMPCHIDTPRFSSKVIRLASAPAKPLEDARHVYPSGPLASVARTTVT